MLEHKEQQKEMKTHVHSTLEALKLDEQESIGYTFKALGAGFYGLRHSRKKSFRDILLEVIMEAGDADRCVLTYCRSGNFRRHKFPWVKFSR